MDFVSWDDEIPNGFRKVIKFDGSSHHHFEIAILVASSVLSTKEPSQGGKMA